MKTNGPRPGWLRPLDRLAAAEFGLQITLLSILAGLPSFALAMFLLWRSSLPPSAQWLWTSVLVILPGVLTTLLWVRLRRPLAALADVLSALREGDFSLRARSPRSVAGPLARAFREANQLESILREQRLGALEASALLKRVLEEIDVAVFAFDRNEELRLLNHAGARLLERPGRDALGRAAAALQLRDALAGPAPRTIEVNLPGGQGRWELKRTVIRQEGEPLKLLVLSDLSRALRQEERLAWRRIIRVLGHEINNSLAPIKSIAWSLRALAGREPPPDSLRKEINAGLNVIAGRAESLGRFMAAYATLARLPAPQPVATEIGPLIHRTAALETRLPVEVAGGPPVSVMADPDQMDQLLINLLRNAADAALETGGGVQVRWTVGNGTLSVLIEDDGPGLQDTANLFVPFYTTKPGGTGVGLALCQQIVEGHGGCLALRNRDRGGAVAVLALPVEGARNADGPARPQPPEAHDGSVISL